MPKDLQRTVAIVNNKGGVGKTTSTLNLAAGLAARKRKVLIIDMDPQANASLALLGPHVLTFPTSIYDILLEESLSLRDIITETPIRGLDVAPAHPNLANAEVNLTAVLGREKVLKRRMEHGLAAYQYILIDCPPSLGLLTVNALLTATEVYIPIAMTYFALEGVDQVMQTINAVKRNLDHPDLEISGVIATFFDGRTRLSHEILAHIRAYFGAVVFQTTIRKNVKLDEAQSHHQSVFDYAPKSTGALEYGNLVEEVIQRESPRSGRKPAHKTSR